MNGLVLAGGKSSRMGRDKSLIAFHGKPQREHLFNLLSIVCSKVFVSCNAKQQVPSHMNPLPDRFEMESPLNGIFTALSTDPSVPWLVVAVDMPNVDLQVLEYLIKKRDPTKVATCFLDSDHKNPEPLLSVWEPKAFSLVEAFYNEGKISPRDFLRNVSIELLAPVSRAMHLNINTPDDAKAFGSGSIDRT